MKKLVFGLAVSLLSIAAYAAGPGDNNPGEGGAEGYFLENFGAFEKSDSGATYVMISRQEYSNGNAYGSVQGIVYGNPFWCTLDADIGLLEVIGPAERVVITVAQDDIAVCYEGSMLAPITFDCVASGYLTEEGVSTYRTAFYDGYEFKVHAKYFTNGLDCVAYIGEYIELNAQSGIVNDGYLEVQKRIDPYLEHDD